MTPGNVAHMSREPQDKTLELQLKGLLHCWENFHTMTFNNHRTPIPINFLSSLPFNLPTKRSYDVPLGATNVTRQNRTVQSRPFPLCTPLEHSHGRTHEYENPDSNRTKALCVRLWEPVSQPRNLRSCATNATPLRIADSARTNPMVWICGRRRRVHEFQNPLVPT